MKPQFFLFLPPILIASLGFACAPEPAPPAVEVPAAVASLPKVVPRKERIALKLKGYAARDAKDYAACADHFGASGGDFIAAGCQAMAGNQEAAFAYLGRAIDGRFDDLEDFDGDANLKSLQGDPRWAAERLRLEAKIAAAAKLNNAELVRLHDEDQADRKGPYKKIDWSVVGPRDQQRRARVNEILAAGGGKTATDYVNAALIFQHGETPEEVWRAHELALKAVELDPEHDFARWLTAASEDRFLVYQKKPQKWGTQFHAEGDKWVLDEVKSDVTDEERSEWNIPPLPKPAAEAKKAN